MHHRIRLRQSNLWSKRLAFPLERLHALIANGTWNDEQSQILWENAYDVPYQLWESDPSSGTELRLQDVSFTCPWCTRTGTIELESFSQTHIQKKTISDCPSCDHQFNADNLSAKYLKDDLSEFQRVEDSW